MTPKKWHDNVPVCPYCGKVIKLMDRTRKLEDGEYHSRCADKKLRKSSERKS